MMTIIGRPQAHECADYYKRYTQQVEGSDVIQILTNAEASTISFLENLPSDKWDYRYAADKWTIKEVWLHILDTERVFAYRAMRIARNDKTALPGFEQDDYIPHCNASNRSIASIIEEYQAVRASTIQLFKYLDENALNRMGTASENPLSPRAAAYIIAGHEIHHLRILNERYLS